MDLLFKDNFFLIKIVINDCLDQVTKKCNKFYHKLEVLIIIFFLNQLSNRMQIKTKIKSFQKWFDFKFDLKREKIEKFTCAHLNSL